MLLDKVM